MIDWTELSVKFADDGTPISGEIVFSHVDAHEGVLRHFAIERIVRDITNGKITPQEILVPIDPKFAMYAKVHRGVEDHRLFRVTPADICNYPIVFAHFPGLGVDAEEHLLIDGHHRYVRAWGFGWSHIRGYSLPKDVWEEYLVYVPEEVLSSKSKKEALLNQHNVPIDSRIK